MPGLWASYAIHTVKVKVFIDYERLSIPSPYFFLEILQPGRLFFFFLKYDSGGSVSPCMASPVSMNSRKQEELE